MTHPSKRKGNRFEQWLVSTAEASAVTSQRAYASNGQALGEHAECDCLIGNVRVQAKRRAAFPACMRELLPSEHVDATAIRADRQEAFIVMRWWDFLDLLKRAERAEQCD